MRLAAACGKPNALLAPPKGGQNRVPRPPPKEAEGAFSCPSPDRGTQGLQLGTGAISGVLLYPEDELLLWHHHPAAYLQHREAIRDPIQRLCLCMGRGGARERNGDPAVMPGGVERTLRRRASARIRWMGTRPAPVPRRRKLYITRFRPKGRKLVHSATPPLPGKTALLGFSGDPAFHVEEQRQLVIALIFRRDYCAGISFLEASAAACIR